MLKTEMSARYSIVTSLPLSVFFLVAIAALFVAFFPVVTFASVPEARELARSVGCTPGALETVKKTQGDSAVFTYRISCANSDAATPQSLLIRCQLSLCQILK